MKDESDTTTSDKKTSTGRKGRTARTSKKQSENDDPAKDDLNLSEGEDSADDKQDSTTTKKGPMKRSAPSSDKKTGKKRSAEDEPFEDRTNDADSAEAENNSEDDGPPAKQAKKGPSAGKAPSSASKTTNRPAKKTKTT